MLPAFWHREGQKDGSRRGRIVRACVRDRGRSDGLRRARRADRIDARYWRPGKRFSTALEEETKA